MAQLVVGFALFCWGFIFIGALRAALVDALRTRRRARERRRYVYVRREMPSAIYGWKDGDVLLFTERRA